MEEVVRYWPFLLLLIEVAVVDMLEYGDEEADEDNVVVGKRRND